MNLWPLHIVAALVLQIGVSLTPVAAVAEPITMAEHDRLWAQAIVALLKFVDAASPPRGALTAELLPTLNAERARFNGAIVKLALAVSPEETARRQLTLAPICQEIGTAMVLITDGVRAGDVAATEAARRWLGDRLVDLRLAMWKLDNPPK
jgi:hypothetical protein